MNNMYTKCEKHVESQDIDIKYGSGLSQYFSTLFLIKTKNGEIFGAFITAFPAMGVEGRFLGTAESFVFFFDPDSRQDQTELSNLQSNSLGGMPFQYFRGTEKNKYYLLCEHNILTIGSGGDGPAIRINDIQMIKGRTAACETFDSPILLPKGEKHVHDSFEAVNFEIFIL